MITNQENFTIILVKHNYLLIDLRLSLHSLSRLSRDSVFWVLRVSHTEDVLTQYTSWYCSDQTRHVFLQHLKNVIPKWPQIVNICRISWKWANSEKDILGGWAEMLNFRLLFVIKWAEKEAWISRVWVPAGRWLTHALFWIPLGSFTAIWKVSETENSTIFSVQLPRPTDTNVVRLWMQFILNEESPDILTYSSHSFQTLSA